jgi:hypothetical protein
MTALNYPKILTESEIYEDFIYDSPKRVWKSLASVGGGICLVSERGWLDDILPLRSNTHTQRM